MEVNQILFIHQILIDHLFQQLQHQLIQILIQLIYHQYNKMIHEEILYNN